MDARDVVLTVLTGARPDLLERTLGSLAEFEPGLLASATVIVLHNGGDQTTRPILARHDGHINAVLTTDQLINVGPATSILAGEAVKSRQPYWLHLEDDWAATGDHPAWLNQARNLLDDHDEIAQVRLRHVTEPVLPRHMVTNRPLQWEDRGSWRFAPDAHWTNNPALMRTWEAPLAWPAAGEREAQRRWHTANQHGVAQLDPGVFVHLGEDGRSLRKLTGSPL